MTDRYNCLTVVLEEPIREDDAERLISAILMMRGVVSVVPHVTNPGYYAARETARLKLVQRIWDVLNKSE